MATRNRVLVTGSVPADLRDMLSEMYSGSVPESNERAGNFDLYPFTLNNKYYSAALEIGVNCAGTHHIDDDLWETVDALVFVVNYADVATSFDHVKQWTGRLEEREPGVMILVARYGDDKHRDTLRDKEVKSWCLEQGLEFIDWDAARSRAAGGRAPDVDSDEDDGNSFSRNEKYGAARVIEALHANMWDSMVMAEGRSTNTSGAGLSLMLGGGAQTGRVPNNGHVRGGNAEESDDDSDGTQSGDGDSDDGGYQQFADGDMPEDLIEKFLAAGMPGGGRGGDDFEAFSDDEGGEGAEGAVDNFDQIFRSIVGLKERTKNLPDAERRILAERVAMNFWRAVGGDDEEIEGLVDSEDEGGAPGK